MNDENPLKNLDKNKRNAALDSIFPANIVLIILVILVIFFQLYSGLRVMKVDFEKALVAAEWKRLKIEKEEFAKNKKEIEELLNHLNQLKMEVEGLTSSKVQIESEVKNLTQQKEKSTYDLVRLDGDIKVSQEKVNAFQSEIDRTSKENSELEKAKSDLNNNLNNLKIENEGLVKTINDKQIALNNIQADKVKLENENKEIENKIQTKKQESDDLDKKTSTLVAKLDELIQSSSGMQVDYSKVIGEMKNGSQQFNEQILNKANSQIEEFNKKIDQLNVTQTQLNSLVSIFQQATEKIGKDSKELEMRKGGMSDSLKKIETEMIDLRKAVQRIDKK